MVLNTDNDSIMVKIFAFLSLFQNSETQKNPDPDLEQFL